MPVVNTTPLTLALLAAAFAAVMVLATPFQVVWHFPITYYDFKGPALARDFTQGVIPSIRDGADVSIGLLTGFDAATGDILWSRPDSTSPGFGSYSFRSYLTSGPELDLVYYTINNTVLVAVNASSGKIVQSRLINSTSQPKYLVENGKIAITTANHARLLDPLTLEDDTVFEGFTNTTEYSDGAAQPILKGTGILFSQSTALFAYVPPSQEPLWQYDNLLLGGGSVVDPHGQYVINSIMSATGFGGNIFGLDAQTGNLLWNVSAPFGYFSFSFSVVTPTLLVSTGGNDDGYQLGLGFISAHKLSTGDLLYNHSYMNYSFMTCSAGRSEIMKDAKGTMVCITALRAPDGDTPVLQLCEIPIGTGVLDTSKCMKLPATSCGASLYEYISIVVSDDSSQVFLSVTNGASETKALVIGLRRD